MKRTVSFLSGEAQRLRLASPDNVIVIDEGFYEFSNMPRMQ